MLIENDLFTKYTMADSDTTQQVTSQTPTTKTKNPKRVAASKAIAEKTRLAREVQKKALDEANAIIQIRKKRPLRQQHLPILGQLLQQHND